jgi:fumarate reductase flavoprotein subunit
VIRRFCGYDRVVNDYDVIVIGAGGAGLAAAATAAQFGARVLVIEAGDRAGGSTALSGGVFYAAGTAVQRARGIEGDTPDAMFQYYMTLNQYKLDASLVRRLCDDAPDAFAWLVELGVEFPPQNLYVAGVDKVARGHRAAGMGLEIATALEGACNRRGVDVVLRTRVRQLCVADDRVVGVRVDGDELHASAVVIATGGFGNNAELLARHYPDAAKHGDLAWYIGSPLSRGDGIEMGEAVGADLAGFNRGLLLVTPGFARDLEVYLPGWLIYVNRDGRRFIDETIEYSVLAAVLKEQVGGDCFAIFDEASRAAARSSPVRPAPNWTADRLAQLVEAGKIVSAETLRALADAVGVRAATLETTIESYNASCDAGADRSCFKPSDALRPVRTPPFYAVRICPAIVCWTGTGLRIDAEARVLDTADRPIPGLYAAGETSGGMFGECYAAGGASIANAIVFGRIAGRNAATRSSRS